MDWNSLRVDGMRPSGLVGNHVHLLGSAEIVSSILVKTRICIRFFRNGKRENVSK